MACVVHNARLYCTVSDVQFGPQCSDDDEAEALLVHVWRTRGVDPRIVDDLDAALTELRSGAAASMPTHRNMLCACGSGETYTRVWYQRGKTFTACGRCSGTETDIERGIFARPEEPGS